MFKATLIFLIIGFCLIETSLSDCVDGRLYCFDSNDVQIGGISVSLFRVIIIYSMKLILYIRLGNVGRGKG